MEFFKMNLYTIYHNSGVFKNRRNAETRKQLINKAIAMTEKDGINVSQYSYEDLESLIWEL